ncbi:MAG: M23 family metallopeptidase [Chitinophagales bacterium]|nr:M23 family metallopeptidase [Chitinophagales bacterium]
MKKEKYYYNPSSLRYEKIEDTWTARLLKLIMFVSATLVFATIIVVLAYTFLDSPKEKQQKAEISKLRQELKLHERELAEMDKVLEGLRYRDANIYRILFEAEPIPDEVWGSYTGGVNRYSDFKKYDNSDVMINVANKIDKLKNQLYIQSKSYDDINNMIKNKAHMLASIPSIQPIANKDLTRMASGFGMRTDPIYKIPKMHHGMDFTAQTGTDVYATGDGVVELVKFSTGGYGNQIIINHGYGYKSRYAHLSRFKVRRGQRVKRGEIIGMVGNTGKSVGPHLHYEVIKSGTPVNPVYFYYNDLSEEQYEKMLEISSNQGQSLD